MKNIVIYSLAFFHEDAKLKFVDRLVNLSFLRFEFFQHRKLHGHVYLACE